MSTPRIPGWAWAVRLSLLSAPNLCPRSSRFFITHTVSERNIAQSKNSICYVFTLKNHTLFAVFTLDDFHRFLLISQAFSSWTWLVEIQHFGRKLSKTWPRSLRQFGPTKSRRKSTKSSFALMSHSKAWKSLSRKLATSNRTLPYSLKRLARSMPTPSRFCEATKSSLIWTRPWSNWNWKDKYWN